MNEKRVSLFANLNPKYQPQMETTKTEKRRLNALLTTDFLYQIKSKILSETPPIVII